MNYEVMWNCMKADLMKRVNNKDVDPVEHEAFMSMLSSVTDIETQEFLQSRNKIDLEYTVTQDIVGNVDIKDPNMEKCAKEMFKQITGNKVIDSPEQLITEINKRKGRAPHNNNQETIVVDECVDIPRDIWHEASVRGIRIARFGLEIISNDEIPKGVFIHHGMFPGAYYGLK